MGLEKDDLYKVDVKGSFAFFNADAQFNQLILDSFKSFKLNGRTISVEISSNPDRKRGDRKRNRKGRSNGPKGSRQKNKGKKKRSGRSGNKLRSSFY